MLLNLRTLNRAKIDGRKLARLAEIVQSRLKATGKLKRVRQALNESAQRLYFRLAGEVNGYRNLKETCRRFNQQFADLLAYAEINGDTLFWTASKEKKRLAELTGEQVRELLYRPSRLEAHHMIKASFMTAYDAQFKKLGKLIEGAPTDPFGRLDATWWNHVETMPAMALEAELHTVGPTRIRDVFGVGLDLEKGFSKSFDDLVLANLAGGSGKLSELFDAHLNAYFTLMSPEWLSRKMNFGSTEATMVEYLVSRLDLAKKAGL